MPTREARKFGKRAGSGTRYWLHYDDPTFERFGGIYVPYATQEDAEHQAASDLLPVGNDPTAIGLLGIFKAEYGSHVPAGIDVDGRVQVDYDQPWGHLDPEAREKIWTPSQIAKLAPKRQREQYEATIVGQAENIRAIHEAIKSGEAFQNAVPGNAYTWCTGGTATAGPAALAAATAKTLVLILSGAANQSALTELGISFDGVTASAVPALVEMISGTAGTAGTPRAALASGKQLRGWPAQTSATTCADTYSAEPGTALVNRKWLVTPNGGLHVMQFPMGREPTGIITAATDAKSWAVRCTAPAIVNTHAYIEYEE